MNLNTAATDRKFKTEKAAKSNAARLSAEYAAIRKTNPDFLGEFHAQKINGFWRVVKTTR